MLSRDEREDVLNNIITCNIDLNQAAKYFLNSQYKQGYDNLLAVVDRIGHLVKKIKD